MLGRGGSRHLPVDPDVFDLIESLFSGSWADLLVAKYSQTRIAALPKLAQICPDARDPKDIILLLNKYPSQKKGELLLPV